MSTAGDRPQLGRAPRVTAIGVTRDRRLGAGNPDVEVQRLARRDGLRRATFFGGPLCDGLHGAGIGVRADGYGTYDEDEGYLVDLRMLGTIGWNAQSMEAYSVVAGWRMTKGVTLRAQYTQLRIDLVDGADLDPAIEPFAEMNDFYSIELGLDF